MARNSILLLVVWALACGGKVSDPASGSGSSSQGGTSPVGGAPQGEASQGGATSTTSVHLTPFTADDWNLATENACNAWAVEEQVVMQSVWLIDGSSSMGWPTPDGITTKWERTRAAVLDALKYYLGGSSCDTKGASMLVYPGQDTDSIVTADVRSVDTCVNVGGVTGPLFSYNGNVPDLTPMKSLLDTVVPRGGTATLDAYRYATTSLDLQGPMVNSVLLVTDGSPSIDAGCINVDARSSIDQGLDAPVEPIIEAIADEYAKGIRTFVVGTPGSDSARSWLSRAALAGGTAQPGCDPSGAAPYCHLDLTLRPDALRFVADTVAVAGYPRASCWLSIPMPTLDAVIDPTLTLPIIRTVDGQFWRVPYDPGPAESCSEGFRVIGTDEIRLCPAACDLLQTDCGQLTVLFFCEPTDDWLIN